MVQICRCPFFEKFAEKLTKRCRDGTVVIAPAAINVARVRFPDSASCVGSLLCTERFFSTGRTQTHFGYLQAEPRSLTRDYHQVRLQRGTSTRVYRISRQATEPFDTNSNLRTVPTIVIAHTFCASRDTRVSYR